MGDGERNGQRRDAARRTFSLFWSRSFFVRQFSVQAEQPLLVRRQRLHLVVSCFSGIGSGSGECGRCLARGLIVTYADVYFYSVDEDSLWVE